TDHRRPEHVRMTPNQLLADAVSDLAPGKFPRLFGNLWLHQHLEEHSPQLLSKRWRLLLVDRFQVLIGFLEHGRPQRGVRLLTVPGTAVRRTEAPHNLDQLRDPLDVVSHWPSPPPSVAARHPVRPRATT